LREASKRFFFEKKQQKTFLCQDGGVCEITHIKEDSQLYSVEKRQTWMPGAASLNQVGHDDVGR
jgi:hypothetical protein